MLTVLYALGGFAAVVAFGIFLHLKQVRYDNRVNAAIDESILRQQEKESSGFARAPDNHRVTAVEFRALRLLLKRGVKLPDDLSARVRKRLPQLPPM